MFGLFRKGKKAPQKLHFKSNAAAFQYACEYLPGVLQQDAMLYGVVLKENDLSDVPFYRRIESHRYTVKLATEHGELDVSNCGIISDAEMASVSIGDLVLVQVGIYNPAYGAGDKRNYFVVIMKLTPVLDINHHAFEPQKTTG